MVAPLAFKTGDLFFGEAIASLGAVTMKVQAQEKMIDPRFLRIEFTPFRHISC